MHEFVLVVAVFVIAGAVIAALAIPAGAVLALIERWLTYAAAALIVFVMLFVCAEVTMRYGFNSPIPGHLELSELFVPIIVFFAISYTQARNAHVGMTVVVEALSPGKRRILESLTQLVSALTCAVLAYFNAKHAYFSWSIDDVTMTPPYWQVWPSIAAIALGYFLIAVRMYLQTLHLVFPNHYPQADAPEEATLLLE